MDIFTNGTKIVFVVPLSRRDPDRAVLPAVEKICGRYVKMLKPAENRQEYNQAFDVVRAHLGRGEKMVCWDTDNAKVSFHTPKREEKAWSAWIRVVDLSATLYN